MIKAKKKRNRSILKMPAEEARAFLLKQESYCTIDLPPYFTFEKILRKISNAEAKDTDVLAKKYKIEKASIDKHITELNIEQNKLYEELGVYKQELSTKTKLIS